MEPGIIVAIVISCLVAVGVGGFIAIQGSKKASQKKSDDDATNPD